MQVGLSSLQGQTPGSPYAQSQFMRYVPQAAHIIVMFMMLLSL